MPKHLLDNLKRCATTNGFDLFGLVAAARFDACQPKEQRIAEVAPHCGAVIVLGSGGCARDDRDLALRLVRLRRLAERALRGVALAEPGRCGLRFVQLAEAAGFGTVSPVTGLLLHPTFGPWVRVHAALLVGGDPFGAVADTTLSDHFQPCGKCRQSCLEVMQEPWSACSLGVEHRRTGATPLPQIRAVHWPPMLRIRMTAGRLLPRFLR